MAQESQPYFSIGATTEQLKACCIEHLLEKWDAGSPMAYIPAVHNIPVQSKNRSDSLEDEPQIEELLQRRFNSSFTIKLFMY